MPLLSIAPLRDHWFAVDARAPQHCSLQQRGLLFVRSGFTPCLVWEIRCLCGSQVVSNTTVWYSGLELRNLNMETYPQKLERRHFPKTNKKHGVDAEKRRDPGDRREFCCQEDPQSGTSENFSENQVGTLSFR